MAIWYVDPENGNDANDGTSFANRVKRFNDPSGLADGDEIRIISINLYPKFFHSNLLSNDLMRKIQNWLC